MDELVYSSRAALALRGVNRGWMLAIGILMTVLGVIGLGMTYSLAVAVVFWTGILAIFAGTGHVFDALHHKEWRGVIWHTMVGIIYALVGIMLIAWPTASAFWLTKLVALALVLTGLMRLVLLFQLRGTASDGPQRAVQLILLVAAVVSIWLGIYIYQLVASPVPEVFATAEAHAAWVRSWKWVIGLFVAIELITDGVALIGISLFAKAARES